MVAKTILQEKIDDHCEKRKSGYMLKKQALGEVDGINIKVRLAFAVVAQPIIVRQMIGGGHTTKLETHSGVVFSVLMRHPILVQGQPERHRISNGNQTLRRNSHSLAQVIHLLPSCSALLAD